jgi:hypothetical protein
MFKTQGKKQKTAFIGSIKSLLDFAVYTAARHLHRYRKGDDYSYQRKEAEKREYIKDFRSVALGRKPSRSRKAWKYGGPFVGRKAEEKKDREEKEKAAKEEGSSSG